MKETDLYRPVRDFLNMAGYIVRAEVKDCDIAGMQDETLVAVELKTVLNLDVILQAAERQLLADFVYIAVPRKEGTLRTQRWRRLVLLLRRLELGLLLVSSKEPHRVEQVVAPMPYDFKAARSQRAKKKRALIQELTKRVTDINTGGSTRTRIMTSYREQAIIVAWLLQQHGAMSPANLKKIGADAAKTTGILRDNHYGWFDHPKRGIYELSEKGINALSDAAPHMEKLLATLPEQTIVPH